MKIKPLFGFHIFTNPNPWTGEYSWQRQEPYQGKVKFPADDPSLMARLLTFLYTGDFPGANTKDGESVISKGQFANLVDPFKKCLHVDELSLYIKMYCLGEKDLLAVLKELALGYYCETLRKYADNIKSNSQHVSSTIFASNLISLVYEAQLPDKDRDLKDPLLVLIHADVCDNKYVDRQMVANAPSSQALQDVLREMQQGRRRSRWILRLWQDRLRQANVLDG